MLPYSWYLLKVIICSGILFGYYWFFLRNKIFHQYNRFYLLTAMLLSLLLPVLKINFWQPTASQNTAINVLQAVSTGDEYMNSMVMVAGKDSWSMEQFYTLAYLLVSLLFLFVLIRTLYRIMLLLKKYPVEQIEQVSFVNTEHASTPFSFFRYIFWNNNIDINTTTGRQIFKHEVAHIQEKHTYDKLFVNIALIFCWCNPFFWLYRKELNMIHEFIADQKAVEDSDTSAFAAMILQAAYPKHQFNLTNNFFYSPIKRRLMMLTKMDNPKLSYIARLMVLPLAVLVFAAFTLKAKNSYASIYNGKKITVVIDAGHGGKDAGASSADGILEKDLTLAIARKIKALNNNAAVEIVLTRDVDVYMNAQEKAAFVKSKNADLVISLHVENGPKGSANTKTGLSVFVAKDEFANAGESKILASAIVNEFSNNYELPVMPQPKQRQLGVWILQANTCPAVLIEAGYINNNKDMAYLRTVEAKETIAKNVLTAIEKYLISKPGIKNISDTLPTIATNDTLPDNEPLDINKALLIVNGKILGRGKKAVEELNNLQTKYVEVKWLKRKEAMAKYGADGAYGACESTYKEGAILTTTYVDADKKSIFYIGLENPLQVSVAHVRPEDLLVRISEGSISGTNGNYTVRVTHIGQVKLTLSKRDGTVLPFKYTVNVKRVPDPGDPAFPENLKYKINSDSNNLSQLKLKVLQENRALIEKVYAEKQLNAAVTDDLKLTWEPIVFIGTVPSGRIQLEYLKSQTDIRLTPGYTLVTATVYFHGPGFEGNVVAVTINSKSHPGIVTNFNRCRDGAQIVFDNVQVKDKEGNIQKLAYTPVFAVGFEDMKSKVQEKIPKEEQRKAIEGNISKAIIDAKAEQDRINNIVFTQVEVSPEFTGGEDAWKKYLVSNLRTSVPVEEGWKPGSYTVIVKFIVRTDGTVSDVTTENYTGSQTARHCIEMIKNAPGWQPAIQNGRKVNAYKKIPISFVVK